MNEEITALTLLQECKDLLRRIQDGEDQQELLLELGDKIIRAYDTYSISDQMYKEYEDWRNDYMNHVAGIENLENIFTKYETQITDADKQITKSLDWNIDDFKDSGENKDSKEVLQSIKDLMTKYMGTYSGKEGMLSAVDEFSAIGDAIKHALEEKTISTTTALLLTESLKHMRDNMFNSETQKKEADLFYDVIDRRLDKEDEKQGPEQGKQDTLNSTGSFLGNVSQFLEKAGKRIHEKIEEDANDAADKCYLTSAVIRCVKRHDQVQTCAVRIGYVRCPGREDQ